MVIYRFTPARCLVDTCFYTITGIYARNILIACGAEMRLEMLGRKSRKKTGLNIIIVGCGKVGATLTEQLSKESHDITLIDKNPEKNLSVWNGNRQLIRRKRLEEYLDDCDSI